MRALPKKTGVCSPARTRSRSKALAAPSRSSRASTEIRRQGRGPDHRAFAADPRLAPHAETFRRRERDARVTHGLALLRAGRSDEARAALREALAQGLNEYEGAVLLISHDRHLVNACADRLWVVQEGTVTPYEGSLDDYRTELLRAVRQQQKADKPARDKNGTLGHHTKSGQKHRKRNAAEKRAALMPLKQAAQLAEERLSELQSAQEKLQNVLTRPNFFRDMPQKAQDLAIKGRQLQIQIAAAEDNWLAAQEAYETALAEE